MAPQRLPVSATPLVGRARELVLLRQLLLDGDVRAVTITGPAGVGKTPLAMALKLLWLSSGRDLLVWDRSW